MKNIICVILILLVAACASAGNKELLLENWEKIEPLLVAKAKKNNDCVWNVKKRDVIEVDPYDDQFKKSFLSDNKLTCDSSMLYLVTFSTYCNGPESDALVSARILKCDQTYMVFSLSLMED